MNDEKKLSKTDLPKEADVKQEQEAPQQAQPVDSRSFVRFKIGGKVRVKNFPPSADRNNQLNWNGLVGTVIGSTHVGRGLENLPVHDYDVLFEDVDIPSAKLDPKTRKIVRKVKKGPAQNRFDENYLEVAD